MFNALSCLSALNSTGSGAWQGQRVALGAIGTAGARGRKNGSKKRQGWLSSPAERHDIKAYSGGRLDGPWRAAATWATGVGRSFSRAPHAGSGWHCMLGA